MKHTPGPWAVYGRILRSVEGGEDQIAEITGELTAPDIQANARLIKTAPRLLEALQNAHAAHPCEMYEEVIREATGE